MLETDRGSTNGVTDDDKKLATLFLKLCRTFLECLEHAPHGHIRRLDIIRQEPLHLVFGKLEQNLQVSKDTYYRREKSNP